MSDKDEMLENPRGRAVALFASEDDAIAAKARLEKLDGPNDQIRFVHGSTDAAEIDDSMKWFADTEEHIGRYKDHVAAGGSAVSVPISNAESVDEVREIFQSAGASLMTQFGLMVTTTETLDP